jgi:hypothetical protein
MKRIRYVYYDKETGRIDQISNQLLVSSMPYIECDVDDVSGFMDDSKNINEYLVAYKKDEEQYVLMKKENIIRLRQESAKLFKIPNRRKESDLTLVYYPDNILEVRLDMSNISSLYMTDFKEEVTFEKGTEFRLTIVNKDSDDVVKEILIEAQDLLDVGVLFFRIPDECHPKNVAFYTYKLLKTYSWAVGKQKTTSPIKENIKYNIHKADTKRKDGFEYHLIFKPITNGFAIKNNIKDLQLVRVYGYLDFFVSDKYDSNILYTKFTITEKMLKNKQFNINFKDDISDMKNKTILYNHKYISVLLEEK